MAMLGAYVYWQPYPLNYNTTMISIAAIIVEINKAAVKPEIEFAETYDGSDMCKLSFSYIGYLQKSSKPTRENKILLYFN